jgi:hypothetical protein
MLMYSDDGSDLLKHVGVNLECINKSYCFLDTFVIYFITILQKFSVQLLRRHSLSVLLSGNHAVYDVM